MAGPRKRGSGQPGRVRRHLASVACATLLLVRKCLPSCAAIPRASCQVAAKPHDCQRSQLLRVGAPVLAGVSLCGSHPDPAWAQASGLDLGILYKAWEKLAEGKNPLEALAPGTRRRLRKIAKDLDALQEDVFSKSYGRVLQYKQPFLAYRPLFTQYTDSVFPGDTPAAAASRVAMRYEVGKFFTAVDRLSEAASVGSQDSVEKAFADMSLAFDRYVKAGDLYEGMDPVVSTELFYRDVPKETLQYQPPEIVPPQIRDRVLLIDGPDKGKTGLMIGKEFGKGEEKDSIVNAFVKFDGGIGEGSERLQEIKLVPYTFVAKQNKE